MRTHARPLWWKHLVTSLVTFSFWTRVWSHARESHDIPEMHMFTRIVSMQLKPNASRQFNELFEKKIVPTLRKQQGFRDEMLFVDPGGPEVVAISLWESKQNAEAYDRAAYPEVLKSLVSVIERDPVVRTFQLAYSTLHTIGGATPPKQSTNTTPSPGVGG